MRSDNPKVTLTDEARNGVQEEVRSGFLDWLYEFSVTGDEGEIYELDGFIPSVYHIRIDTEDGVYEVRAHVGNARTWGVTYQVPDNPVATLLFDEVSGRFVYKDGTAKNLTGGRGAMSVRQWHAYPNILPRELYSDDQRSGEKFDTL